MVLGVVAHVHEVSTYTVAEEESVSKAGAIHGKEAGYWEVWRKAPWTGKNSGNVYECTL